MTFGARHVRNALKSIILGSANIHQYRTVGLRDPQSEVMVTLRGLGTPRDVTGRNVVASTRPLTLGIGLEKDLELAAIRRVNLSLEFRERQGGRRLLGEIVLRVAEPVPLEDGQLCLVEPQHAKNYCVARPWLWARYLYLARSQRRSRRRPGAPEAGISAGDLHSLFVFYTCPRPVFLVSVEDAGRVNMVPMDLVGPVSAGRFSLALHGTSTAALLMERSRRAALSSVPFGNRGVAYQLGGNHVAPGVEVDRLPFAVARSAAFGLPVPEFALRVQEMEIESVREVGAYRLYIAKPVKDTRLADGLQFCLVHGFYQRLAGASDLSPTATEG